MWGSSGGYTVIVVFQLLSCDSCWPKRLKTPFVGAGHASVNPFSTECLLVAVCLPRVGGLGSEALEILGVSISNAHYFTSVD